jgi:phospholipid/cholesterol/gamma-HCH transport system substrate-binding protein
MKRSGRVKWGELRVGIVILFAFALLLWASFTGTGFTVFANKEPLVAHFPSVNGLITGSPVWMSGIEVGHVSGIGFVEREGRPLVRVDFLVKQEPFAMITSGCKVAVGTMGLMGDRYLDIQTGDPGASPVSPGAELGIVQSADLTTAFSGTAELMDDVGAAVGQFNTILERLNRGEGFLGGLTTASGTSANIDSLILSARELLTELNASQGRLTVALSEAAEKLSRLGDKIESGDGSLSRLVNDSSLYVNLSSISSRADRLLASWEAGEGTAGRLLRDETVYEDVHILLGEIQALIDDIKLHPKKYFKVSLF